MERRARRDLQLDDRGWHVARHAPRTTPYSAWFILGEIVRRIDGRPFDKYVREEIFMPLEMWDCYIGMSRETFGRYHAEGRFAELRTMSPKGKVLAKSTVGTSPDEVMATVPGSNGRGPCPQWLLLFECLMLGGVGRNGIRVLEAATVAKFTRRHRVGMYDVGAGHHLRLVPRALCAHRRGGPQITGHFSSRETYGHGGSQSSVGFVDPAKKLSVCIVCNTRPGPKHHYERMCEISSAIYQDLGLASGAVPRAT